MDLKLELFLTHIYGHPGIGSQRWMNDDILSSGRLTSKLGNEKRGRLG